MARTGDPSLRISRNQSSVLRRAHRTTPRQGLTIAKTRNLPLGKWLLPGGHTRRAKHRYDHGIYAPGRANDGNALRFCGPRNNDLLDATRWTYGTPTRRDAQHKIRPAGNLWDFGGHAADRGGDERWPPTGEAGF